MTDELSGRFHSGEVIDHQPYTGGAGKKSSTYFVEGPDRTRYAFDYSDILTEGFRTIEVGERVRFLAREEPDGLRARYVVKLDSDITDLHYAD